MHKTENKRTVIFLTTKKGTEKGTKDIYMVNQDGATVEGAKGVKAIYFDKHLPIGVSALNPRTQILIMNPTDIIVDPFHPVKVLDTAELGEEDTEVYKMMKSSEGYAAIQDTLSETAAGPQEDLLSFLDKAKASSQEFINSLKGADIINKSVQKCLKECSEEDQLSAVDTMNELANMFKSGQFDDKRFRELIPEGSFLEFSKKLSQETGDSSYYNIASMFEKLNPKKA